MTPICATPDCGATIPPQNGSARPRKYCVTCRPPRNRANPRVVNLSDTQATKHQKEPPQDEAPVLAAYRRQLVTAERLDTPEGAHVMHLAALFATGNHTSSGAASLSRELRAAMEEALKGAPRQADRMDEIAERRRRKAAGA